MKREYNIEEKVKAEELRRCKEGHDGMTGEEYFFYNYCHIDGKLPEPNSYTKEGFKVYQEMVKEKRELMRHKARRVGPKMGYLETLSFYQEHPISPEDALAITKAFEEAKPKPIPGVKDKIVIVGTGGDEKFNGKDFENIFYNPDELLLNTCPNCKKNIGGGVMDMFNHQESEKCYPKYEEPIDLDTILEVLESREKEQKKKERGYMITFFCKGIGRVISVDMLSFTPCNNDECGLCSSLRKSVEGWNKKESKTVSKEQMLKAVDDNTKKDLVDYQHKSKFHK